MSDIGQQGYFAFLKQSAQGVAAIPTNGYKVTSVDFGGVSDLLVADAEIGVGRDRDTAGVGFGSYHAEGSVEAMCRFDALGWFLMAAGFVESGAPVQDAATGAYTHTFVPGAYTYLTTETSWGLNRAVRRFVDTIVDTLELSVAADEFVNLNMDLLALSESWQAAPITPTFPALDPTGTYLGSKVTLDGLGTYRLGEFAWNLANNTTNDEAVIGQRALVDLTPKRREVSFTGNLKINPSSPSGVTDLYRAAMYGSKTATATSDVLEPYHTSAVLTFGSVKLAGTSTTVRYGCEITMPDVVLEAFPLESSGDDVIEASITGQAFKGASPVSTIKVFNARSAAY